VKKKSKNYISILIILILICCLLFGGYFFLIKKSNSINDDWGVYKNDNYKFEFRYPVKKVRIDIIDANSSNPGDFQLELIPLDPEKDNNVHASVDVYFDIPNEAFSNSNLNDYIHDGGKGFESSFSISIDKWRCRDATNVGGDKILDCYFQNGKNVYSVFNYKEDGALTNEEFQKIISSFVFIK